MSNRFAILMLFFGFNFCEIKGRLTNDVRKYYIAAVEIEWDYSPSGHNLIDGDDEAAATFIGPASEKKIGSIYKKAVYRQYTDESFSEQIPHPDWLGVLGPIIRAEVKDTVIIIFKNMASGHNYSVHAHGVFYEKNSEGAWYADGSAKHEKVDDSVAPGNVITYIWKVTFARGPRTDEQSCQTWFYHSHTHPEHDMNTGLMGPLLICKKGTLNRYGQRLDVNKEYVILFTVLDENFNWYLDYNIEHYIPVNSSNLMELKEDEDFMEQNKKHSINGYIFGNLPSLFMCLGDNVSWHFIGVGNEVDIHTAHFHGNTLISEQHRTDVISLFPATFISGCMKATNLGKWLLTCQVHDHIEAGMQAFYEVKDCSASNQTSNSPNILPSRVREYFIAAEEIEWDYAPSGKNVLEDVELENDENGMKYAVPTNHSIGRKYKKVQFIQYTDHTFSKKVPADAFLGILGPVIRAEVGELIKIHFLNKATRNYSMIAHGVSYNKNNEGSVYNDNTEGTSYEHHTIAPTQKFTYYWRVTQDVAPTVDDPNCLTWWYTSGANIVKDSHSGLNGILLTCKPGTLDANGKQIGVKEFPLMFTIFDENKSWYLSENLRHSVALKYIDPEELPDYVQESNQKFSINGYLFGNLQGLEACKDSNISWHLLGMGNEADVHVVYFHGHTFTFRKQNLDSIPVFPAIGHTITMKADNFGKWAIECRTNDHMGPGMRAMYNIIDCFQSTQTVSKEIPHGRTRIYYIAAEELVWNYIHDDLHIITEKKLTEHEDSSIFVTRDSTHIGTQYKKAVFRQYKDASFKQEISTEGYLGILGPCIKAEVGDTIKVVFKNLASRNYSIHPHGVMYDKENEGWLYNDGNHKKADDMVAPGCSYTYTWKVPERAGPTNEDFNCATWSYYSAVDAERDTNSGLIGPLIICRKKTLRKSGERKDVKKEFALLFTVFDENLSWYLDENINTYCTEPYNVSKDDEDFIESNKKHTINGYLYGNNTGLRMYQKEKVAWYLIGMGSAIDIHTVHFHGQTFLNFMDSYHVNDVINLFPGIFKTVEMIPDAIGTWLLHCHVNDHSMGGMTTLFVVEPKIQNLNSSGLPVRKSLTSQYKK